MRGADPPLEPGGGAVGGPRRGGGRELLKTDRVAGAVAPGESSDTVRSYLKGTAKATWQLVSWLTHARNAHRVDAMIALRATESVLVDFSMAVTRLQRGTPDRCPSCSSYRIASDFRPDLDPEPRYVSVCESCGWSHDPAGPPERLHS